MFLEVRVFIWDDEKVWGVDSGDGDTTLGMYFSSLNCTAANGQNDKYHASYTLP